MRYVDFQKCIPVSGYIYILMRYLCLIKYVDFEMFLSGYKDIYFDQVR